MRTDRGDGKRDNDINVKEKERKNKEA